MQYTLTKGPLRAVAQTHGGELISFQNAVGTEYIWDGNPAFWTGRNPILFPIVGVLRNDRVEINGTYYELPRHGFARDNEFSLTEQTPDTVTLELRETPETLAHYPFPFSLQVRHQLLENGFSTTFIIENTGNTPMPCCIGAHTAIRCPLHDGERFEDYQLVFDASEDADTLLRTSEGMIAPSTEPMVKGGLWPLDYETFRRLDTLMFRGLQSKTVSLLHQKTGHGVKLDFHEFPAVAFWTKPDASYLCMEPWHGHAGLSAGSDCFEEKAFLITLRPGGKKTLTYTFTLV
ncbi:MAG: aldose 1-epimerase family protein [Oscillibacter sp.]|nr:aldose 1-epimerase family protein [Oscillibacter sp.]